MSSSPWTSLAQGQPDARKLLPCISERPVYYGSIRLRIRKVWIYCIVLHSYVRNFLSNPRRIHSGQKDKEKEEYGLL
jgi:hypothetical protein